MVRRVCALVFFFAAVALSLVWLRAEQTRCAARTLRLQNACLRLRRTLWEEQAVVARLRAPERLHERMEWFRTDLVSPEKGDELARPRRWVSRFSR